MNEPLPKICYVVSVYTGDRRSVFLPQVENHSFYISQHLEQLKKYKHSISQITIMINQNINETIEFTEYLKTIPKEMQNAKVVVIERANEGISYGAFSDAFSRFRNDFDYFIFIEDDYSFVEDDFDLKMLNIFNEKKDLNIGFLSCYTKLSEGCIGVTNGFSSKIVLDKVFNLFGSLPHGSEDWINNAQYYFFMGFTNAGFSHFDVMEYFSIMYYDPQGYMRLFGSEIYPLFLAPAQFLFYSRGLK